MTKGDKYREYYLRNRDRILKANRERGVAYREKLRSDTSPETVEARRTKLREAYYRRRAKFVKTSLETANASPEWKVVYDKLATAKHLEKVGTKMLNWLLSASGPDTS